jgi:hypothetical protein
MSYEYASTLFDTRSDMIQAKAHDFMTACGTESEKDAARDYRENRESCIDEAVYVDWFSMPREDVADALDEWYRQADQ